MKVEKVCRIKNNKLRSLTPSAFETGDYEMQLLNVYDEKISTIKGFGGAFTDSAAYNYHLASESVKKQILEQLFGESGLKYNFCRLCIGSSDFAVDRVKKENLACSSANTTKR